MTTLDEHRAAFNRLAAKRREIMRAAGGDRVAAARKRALSGNGAEVHDALTELLDVATNDSAYWAAVNEDSRLYDEQEVHYRAIKEHERGQRQARVNAREAAATRAAMCDRCFMVHAAECL